MSGPPPPPKRKNRQSTNSIVGAGHNVARSLSSNNNAISHSGDCAEICSFSNEPDSIIGEGVEIYGDFHFDKLLRINGKFHGKLISKGDLIVSSQGCIVGNISSIKRMIVDGGNVMGDIVVEELLLTGNAIIKGNISCKLFQVIGQDVSIIGRVNIQPLSPELVDQNDNIVASLVKKPKKSNKPFPPSIVVSPIRIGTEVASSLVASDTRLSTVNIPTGHTDTALLNSEPTKSERAAVDEARLEHLLTKERRQAAANEKAAKCSDVVKNEDGATGSDILDVNVKSAVPARSVDDCVDESVASLAVLSDGVVISPPHSHEQHNAPSDLPEYSDDSIDRSRESNTEMSNLLLPSHDQGEEQQQQQQLGAVNDVGDQVSSAEKAEDLVPLAADEDVKTEWGDHREEASPDDQPNPPEISTTILEPPASSQVEATVILNEGGDHTTEIQSNGPDVGFSLNDLKQQFNTMADTVVATDSPIVQVQQV